MRDVFCFQGVASGSNPARRPLPDWMNYARAQTVFGVERCHAAPYHCVRSFDEFGFDLSE
jgi:hypothetical protein